MSPLLDCPVIHYVCYYVHVLPYITDQANNVSTSMLLHLFLALLYIGRKGGNFGLRHNTLREYVFCCLRTGFDETYWFVVSRIEDRRRIN